MKLHRRVRTGRTFDPFLGDERVRVAAQELQAGDWLPAVALAGEVEDRSLVLNLLTSQVVDVAAIQTWVDADPTALSLTMLAMRQVSEAWAIGRSEPGERSQDEIDEAFRAQLRVAEDTIAQACGKDPTFVDAWAAAVPIATGLQQPREAIIARFGRTQGLHPYHRNATISMLRANFARWGGSDTAMFEFARHVAFHNAFDSPLQVALPIAQLEYVAAHGNPHGYLNRVDVRDELKYVVLRFLQTAPDGPAPIDQLEALNTFVACLGRMRPVPRELLVECIARIADRPTAMPWRRGRRDPAEAYHSFVADLV